MFHTPESLKSWVLLSTRFSGPWFLVLSPTSDMGLGSQALILTKDHESWVSLFRYAVIVMWFNLLTRSIIMMYTIEPSQQTFVLVNTYWRRLRCLKCNIVFQDILKTYSRHFQDIIARCLLEKIRLANISSKRLEDVLGNKECLLG